MKIRSYVLMVVLLLSMAFALCACGEDEKQEEPKIEATPTTAPTHTPTPTEVAVEKATYTVKVVDEANNPMAGVMVQICKDACIPAKTGEDGVAVFTVAELADGYKASVLSMPEGYQHISETTEFYFEEGQSEITITLAAVTE